MFARLTDEGEEKTEMDDGGNGSVHAVHFVAGEKVREKKWMEEVGKFKSCGSELVAKLNL